AKPAALVFAKKIDLVQAGRPLRVVLRRMAPDEADQLFGRRLEHKNEMRGVDFRQLLAPLPFASGIGRSRPEWTNVRLIERANMEFGQRSQIGDAGLA